jgi:hypothetical protein
MGRRDQKIVDRLIDAAEDIDLDASRLKQKDIAKYLGISDKKLSEWLNNAEKDYLTADNLAQLTNTLKSYPYKSNENRLGDIAMTIMWEILFGKMPVICKDYGIKILKNNEKIRFCELPTSILVTPSPAEFPDDFTQLIADLADKNLDLRLIITDKLASQAAFVIEKWSYGPSGNYTTRLSIKVHPWTGQTNLCIIGSPDSSKSPTSIFALDQDAEIIETTMPEAFLKNVIQPILTQDAFCQIHASPFARKIERFVRSVPQDWHPEIVEFLVSKIIKIEETDQNNGSDDVHRDIFTETKKELSESLGDDIAKKFWNRLLMYLPSLESTYFN